MIGDFLAKLVTAPIKVVVMPFKVIADVVEDDGDNFIETITDSIEKQVKGIVNLDKE